MFRIVFLIVISLTIASCSSRVVYESSPILEASSDAININTATAADLERLPHIGRKTSETIIQFREENGPFRRVEHILQIRGISEKRFLEIQPFLKAE